PGGQAGRSACVVPALEGRDHGRRPQPRSRLDGDVLHVGSVAHAGETPILRTVTIADVIVIAWVAISAVVGFRRGLAAQALALGGFALGAWVGSRLAPDALSPSARVDWAPVAALAGAIACGALAQIATAPIASMLRRRVLLGPLATIDGAGGMVVGAALGLG